MHLLLYAPILALVLISQADGAANAPNLYDGLCNSTVLTAQTCGRTPGNPISFYCTWDSITGTCAFRSRSCPDEFMSRMQALASCGSTLDDKCPPPCQNAMIQLMAVLYSRAGYQEYHRTDNLMTRSMTDDQTAQAQADHLYCSSHFSGNYPAFVSAYGYCQSGDYYSDEVVTAAMHALKQ